MVVEVEVVVVEMTEVVAQ